MFHLLAVLPVRPQAASRPLLQTKVNIKGKSVTEKQNQYQCHHRTVKSTCFRHGHVLDVGGRAVLQLDHLAVHDLSVREGGLGVVLDVGRGAISEGDGLQADGVHALHLISVWEADRDVNRNSELESQDGHAVAKHVTHALCKYCVVTCMTIFMVI